MSRFADPTQTATIVIGPCQCPGTPHQQDEALVRTRLGGSAMARIGRAGLDSAGGDHYAAHRRLVLEATLSWNLLWDDPAWKPDSGEERKVVPAAINEGTVELLDGDTLRVLAEAIDEHTRESPPNASAAPSRVSRQVRRSRTRTTSQRHTTSSSRSAPVGPPAS